MFVIIISITQVQWHLIMPILVRARDPFRLTMLGALDQRVLLYSVITSLITTVVIMKMLELGVTHQVYNLGNTLYFI